MPTWADDYGAGAAPPLVDLGTTLTAHRFVAFSGNPPVAGLCTGGQDADAVTLDGSQSQGYLAVPGLPVQVETNAAIASGATLESDSIGRCATWVSGAKV